MRAQFRIVMFGIALVTVLPLTAWCENPDPELWNHVRRAMTEADSFDDKFHAEVWLKLNSTRLQNYVEDKNERIEILTNVHREASRWNLPPSLVLAVIDVESAFNKYALSRVYARGLMQIMPFWADVLNVSEQSLMDINTNIRIGCAILAHYKQKENGDYVQALNRYNGTTDRRKYADKVLQRLSARWYD